MEGFSQPVLNDGPGQDGFQPDPTGQSDPVKMIGIGVAVTFLQLS